MSTPLPFDEVSKMLGLSGPMAEMAQSMAQSMMANEAFTQMATNLAEKIEIGAENIGTDNTTESTSVSDKSEIDPKLIETIKQLEKTKIIDEAIKTLDNEQVQMKQLVDSVTGNDAFKELMQTMTQKVTDRSQQQKIDESLMNRQARRRLERDRIKQAQKQPAQTEAFKQHCSRYFPNMDPEALSKIFSEMSIPEPSINEFSQPPGPPSPIQKPLEEMTYAELAELEDSSSTSDDL